MAEEFRVAVLGDSGMWGQGLREEDKYALKSANRIAALLERQARVRVNLARSGACIRGGRTDDEAKERRAAFVDTYPALFGSAALAAKFVEENVQDVALLLNRELPSSFPTISYQVQAVPQSVAVGIDLVIINGGVNDLDFQAYLNPTDHRDDFVQHYDPLIKEYFYARTRSILLQARKKFPNAVIILTGYWSPFAEGVGDGEMKDLFEHESNASAGERFLNDVLNVVNVEQLVLEAQARSQYGLARGLYWARRAVAEANEDVAVRGPGILFAHPQFGPENSAFGPNSFCHREYKLSDVRDPASQMRRDTCPRVEQATDYAQLWVLFSKLQLSLHQENQEKDPKVRNDIFKEAGRAAEEALARFQAPTRLLDACRAVVADTTDESKYFLIIATGISEQRRISNALRASFLHPNEKGAERYAGVIVKRFDERHRKIGLRDALTRLARPGAGSSGVLSLNGCLDRYQLRSQHSLRAIAQLLLVDSVAVEIATAPGSQPFMFDDIVLDLGGDKRWRLNLPYRQVVGGRPGDRRIVPRKMHPHFEPGATDLFAVDARAVHLGSIRQFVLERRASPAVQKLPDVKDGAWRASRVALRINGVEVFSDSAPGSLKRGTKLTFAYPR